MELTETLLQSLRIDRKTLEPLPPWPSEAAQWAQLGSDAQETTRRVQAKLARNSLKPQTLEWSIAELARMWFNNKPRGRFAYNGLILLTTRIDLGLEFALAQQPELKFTRFLPTAWGSKRLNWETYVVQQWRHDNKWEPDPPHWTGAMPWDPEPCNRNKGLNSIPLDKFHNVLLIKLCGSLDLQETLMLTIRDFFEKEDRLQNIPQQLRLSINSSPQILLGCGFASPLAQLVRLKLLDGAGSMRVLVMPPEQPATSDQPAPVVQDFLNTLEMRLVRERLESFKDAFDLSELYRMEQHNFIDRLVAGLNL
jgi:hypothetical protein